MKLFCYILGAFLAAVCANAAVCREKTSSSTAFGDHDEVDFLVSLYKASFNASGNYIASPISIRYVLAMIYMGSRANSNSETDLRNVAKFNADKRVFLPIFENSEHLKVANQILSDSKLSLNQHYKEAVQTGYKTEVEPTNFVNAEALVLKLNKWVTEKTDGFITEILTQDDIYADLRLLLLNAISFKAMWRNQFSLEDTDQGVFEANGVKYNVDMMNGVDCYRFFRNDNVEVLELPYEEKSDFVMWFLLPAKSSSLAQLVDSLSFSTLETINNGLKLKTLEVFIPMFDISYKTDGKTVLAEMGLNSIFTNTDLDVFDTSEAIGVSDILQNARINVHEGGTEAGAVTAGSARSRTIISVFEVNRPFAFMILQESTKKPIFVGHFSKPAGEQ